MKTKQAEINRERMARYHKEQAAGAMYEALENQADILSKCIGSMQIATSCKFGVLPEAERALAWVNEVLKSARGEV